MKITKDELFRTAGLLIIFGLGVSIAYSGIFEKAYYFLPTWDNSMLHAGRAVYTIETGHYPWLEVVFGGKTPTYHPPIYAALIAGTSLLTGLDFAWTERLMMLIFAALLPFGIYLLAKGISGDWRAGVAAAIIALYSPDFMSWATRNTPCGLGNIAVPILLYLVLERRTFAAALLAMALAFDHQPSLLVAIISVFFFFAYSYLKVIYDQVREKVATIAKAVLDIIHPDVVSATAAGLVGFLSYMAWHVYKTGLACLNFACLPQNKAHEFGKPIDLVQHFSQNPQFISIVGILLLPFSDKIPVRSKALAFSYLVACLLLVKNELFGFGTFTERFLTYFDCALAVFAGVGIAIVLGWVEEGTGRESKSSQMREPVES